MLVVPYNSNRLKKLDSQEILKQAVKAKLCCVNKMFCYLQWDGEEAYALECEK